jgi:cytochrome c peroxidase
MESPFPGSRRHSGWRPVLSSLALALLGLPVLAQDPPVAAFTTNPNPAVGGDSLTVQFIDQSTGAITSWLWDFGDLTSSSDQNPTHTYGIGTFNVSLTVTGPGGSNTFTLLHAVDVVQTLFGFIGAPPPLSSMTVPRPSNLGDFVVDEQAAVRLGKALFWDVQLGSDGLTACASCHYHAGVDNRAVNTLHPGADGVFDTMNSGAGGGPNYALNAGDFPFHKLLDPLDADTVFQDTDDRRGATGVFKADFDGIDPFSAVDLGTDQPDGTFQVGGINALQATGRDAPTALGTVFFHRIFWDGRANHRFNGRNIWGDTDPSEPKVLEMLGDGSLGEIAILLDNAAAASQAIGPPLSDVEMSWNGRSWFEVGRKMIPLVPLASQFVDPNDSVLGGLANLAGNGLEPTLTYQDMIQAAFHKRWWGSSQLSEGFTQMEKNFSLFFGLAILMYESTLIPDRTPYDAFASGDESALTDAQKRGLGIFLGKGKCSDCHATSMFAGAITADILQHSDPNEGEGLLEKMAMGNELAFSGLTFSTSPVAGELPLNFNPYRRMVAILTAGGRVLASARMPSGARCLPAGERVVELVPTFLVSPAMQMKARVRIQTDGNCGTKLIVDVEWNELAPSGNYQVAFGGLRFPFVMPPATRVAVYDNGFYNIGVRPTAEDRGVGNSGPFGPLSLTRRKQLGETLGTPSEEGVTFVSLNERVAVDGAFKTPTLRNVELTGPYMHNGGMATLEQVAEFYARGTDFGSQNARDLDPDVGGFPLTEQDKADLVAFLKSLTDPRVRFEQAPFDHPELPLKEGLVGDHLAIDDDGTGKGIPVIEIVAATGAAGGPAIPAFESELGAALTAAEVGHDERSSELVLFLDRRPTASVVVDLRLSDRALVVSPQSLTFTPQNWRRPQRAVITSRLEGASLVRPVTVDFTLQSRDPAYAWLPVKGLVLSDEASEGTTVVTVPGGAGTAGLR